MKMTIGNFLFSRLQEMGVNKVFGVPGDFNLQLLDQIEEVENLSFVGNCNELNAAYAADGYGRTKGISALITTYGVGDLSALCGVAGACAEHVPMVFISGVPPLHAIESRLRVHHSLAEGDFKNVMNSVREFTVAQTRLNQANAADEIDRVLKTCWIEKQPVYIQVPSNISYLLIDVPNTSFNLSLPTSDNEHLDRSVKRVTELLNNSNHPLMLIDMDADRSNIVTGLEKLSNKCQIPYASFRTGKALLSESSPLFLGMYMGENSAQELLDKVEHSDCIIATAPCFFECSTMAILDSIPSDTAIYITSRSVTVDGEVFEGVMAQELVDAVLEKMETKLALEKTEMSTKDAPIHVNSTQPLTQRWLWPQLGQFFQTDDVIIVENGTSNIAMTDVRLPTGVKYISQLLWGSIGYSLPALLGSMMAAPKRRHILFIGDGSFQLTAQELSTILACGLKPIIFLLNNRGYTIERYIQGMNAEYNDVVNWNYLSLTHALAPKTDLYLASVETDIALEKTLKQIECEDRPCIVELHLDPFDAPEALKVFGPKTAALDYGTRRESLLNKADVI